ncbi:PKD domain-containing protein [Flavobacterium sp. xlx-214]|uniref:PKD domain-containing protein n=1 Tax=unclassified Flavobacterium TaxID=196869 RepID=UPI0013D2EF6D|nr:MULTISPECIES: PKD domain-containing protein [unclassified Flavobacterium]MBA5792686.1 PKD domain-containing protein [Flavobacterium sp. xlx-221]QMI83831.1 PKD domain-containing protein [Flavobacterium sp. xlx-214]
MKNITRPPIRALGILLMFLLSFQLKAQTPNSATLTWDQQVGCIRYDDEVKEGEGGGENQAPSTSVNLMENMLDGSCLRFCEFSYVTYTLQGNNIANVQWQVSGGTLNSSNNTNAYVSWGTVGGGSLTISITYSDNTVVTRTICIEKIVRPDAKFLIDGIDPYQQVFCVGTPISFNNLSTANNGSAIVNYLWDFGDGTFSNAFEPTHTYTNSGSYVILLTVTNSCNCSATYEYPITVLDAKPIEITCLNVTCEYNTETYTANDGCGGDWKVIGGTIVGGGNGSSSVTVVWDQVDPADGFGYISYLSYCNCPYWNTVKIPVVVRHVLLQGPQIICQGKQAKYSLPQWPTTDFKWSINGDPNHPMIVYTDQRNEIMVDGMAPGTYFIDVEYQNTLLGTDNCRGQIERFVFEVVENVSVNWDQVQTVCAGTSKFFSSSNGSSVSWEIKLGNNIVHTDFNSSTSFTFNSGGSYTVTATNNGCISDAVVINVIPTPVITGAIVGPAKVCLNVPYTYSITENDPGAIYVWTATGGSIIGSNAGTEVAAVFTSSTGTVSVVKQYVKNGVICASAPVTYNVSQVVVNPTITNNSGLMQFCSSSIYDFTANLNGVDVDHIEWKISPPNFGNIINGVNDGTVTIGLNEESLGVTSGTLVVEVTKCGIKTNTSYQINLIGNVSLTIGTIAPICPGTPFFDVPITSSAPANLGTLEFLYDGIVLYTTPYIGSTPLVPNYSIPQSFTNPSNSASIGGILTVRLVNPFGCTTTIIANKAVTILPATTVEIFNESVVNTVCTSNAFSIDLKATFSTGVTSSDTFYWYRNNNSSSIASGVGMTSLTLNNGFFPGAGEYYVQVTDVNGCLITSNKIWIFEDCSPGGPGNPGSGCTLGFNPIPTLTYSWLPCGTVNLHATYDPAAVPSIANVEWEAVTFGATLGTFNNDDAQFNINNVGLYELKVKVRYANCPDTFVKTITVRKHYEPILRYVVTCLGNNSYNIELKNNSKMFDINASSVNISYFDAANNLLGTGQSALVTGVGPGVHTYKMVLNAGGQLTANGTPIPDCETTIQVEIQGPPPTAFTIAPTKYCAEEPITLTLPSAMLPGYRYEWHFLNTYYVAAGLSTQINISTAGQHDIKLRVYNQYDCMFESADVSVDIFKAEFDGKVNPNPLNFCEGSAVTPLQFQPNPFTDLPTNAIWMRDNVQVAASGLTYTPTQSGSYWPILIDAKGCKFYGMSANPAIVTMRKPPFASINGNTSVCYGESTTLTGIYTDPNVEHRWTLNGNALPGSMGNWTTGAGNLTLSLSGLTPGSYNYAFETRLPNDTSCVNSFKAVVVFHPQLATPNINFNLVNCQPYTLELTANGPAAGTYNWSNGMIGQTIYVTHGGAYSVTYTAPTGCSVMAQVQTPHNPERTLWIVPAGCYRICASYNPYLLAPYGVYNGYLWSVNGWQTQTGGGFIPNQLVNQSGEYQLAISTASGCIFYSNKPRIDLDYGCRTANKTTTPTVVTKFVLSPNPTTDTTLATFDTGTNSQAATSITVHDVTGVQRLQQKLSGSKGEVVLNVSYLAPGTYIVNLHVGATVIAQQKLIKK